MPDNHANFAYSTVATAPSPAASGTSLVVATGGGALMPVPPFNAVVWSLNARPLASNAEIIQVTAVATDTLTIVRAQEGSSPRSIVVGDQIAAAITAKTLTDSEGSLSPAANFQIRDGFSEVVPGPYTLGSGVTLTILGKGILMVL